VSDSVTFVLYASVSPSAPVLRNSTKFCEPLKTQVLACNRKSVKAYYPNPRRGDARIQQLLQQWRKMTQLYADALADVDFIHINVKDFLRL
jgi:hypothetical protein